MFAVEERLLSWTTTRTMKILRLRGREVEKEDEDSEEGSR